MSEDDPPPISPCSEIPECPACFAASKDLHEAQSKPGEYRCYSCQTLFQMPGPE